MGTFSTLVSFLNFESSAGFAVARRGRERGMRKVTYDGSTGVHRDAFVPSHRKSTLSFAEFSA